METPNLILSIDEGPKKGETLDRRPGSFIRIGRVLRGNTIAIKDAGISQKHLIVEFQMSQWTVTDLGASNGTTVNGAAIAPKVAFPLTDGDTIKIGENTLMSVKISAASSAPEPRTRGGRRAAAALRSPIGTEVNKEKVTEPAKDGGNAAREVGRGKVEEPTRSEGKGMGKSGVKPAKILRKDAPLAPAAMEQKRGRDVKALSAVSSATVVVIKDEEGQASEKIEVLPNGGRGGRRGKKGIGSSKVLWKDDALEPVVVEGKGRVHEVEDGEIKEEKVEREDKKQEGWSI